ncbi:MAG: thiamine-monophosphate kinase [bacterium]|nr:MAG: thiamine-monophosphate kinase [bacterium]
MKEFELIEYIAQKFSRQKNAGGLILPIGDDCSAVRPPKGFLQVTTADSLVEGNHFSLEYFSKKDIGRKAVRVNISDLASMGAIGPYYAWLTFAIPGDMKEAAVKRIIDGIRQDCLKYPVVLAGGNITSAREFSIHVTMSGWVKKTNLLTRSGAKPGDVIFVTGNIGGPTMAYKQFKQGKKPEDFLLKCWALPHPKPEIGIFLADKKIATSCIDISDGIFQDLQHVTLKSGVGAVIQWDRIPVLPKLKKRNPTPDMIGFGEDYELLFTVPPSRLKLLAPIAGDITEIGRIVKKGFSVMDDLGKRIDAANVGYHHFI